MTDRTTGTEVPATPVLARGLTKRYGDLLALDALDLEVEPGTVLGIVGPKDAGKTTCIRLLAGLARPTSGTLLLGGVAPGSREGLELRRRIGVALEEPRFYGWMTGRELVAFAGQLVGLERGRLDGRVREVLARAGLQAAADRRLETYSAAMRQRLGVAQALVGGPGLLLLDEPVASLDPAGRREVLQAVREERDRASVILSTETLADAELVADRVAVLDAGRLVFDESLATLAARLARPVYAIDPERGQEAAVQALRTRLRLEGWVEGTILEGGILSVAVLDPNRAARDLLPLVVAAGVRVASVTQRRPTLRDVLALARTGEPSAAHASQGRAA